MLHPQNGRIRPSAGARSGRFVFAGMLRYARIAVCRLDGRELPDQVRPIELLAVWRVTPKNFLLKATRAAWAQTNSGSISHARPSKMGCWAFVLPHA